MSNSLVYQDALASQNPALDQVQNDTVSVIANDFLAAPDDSIITFNANSSTTSNNATGSETGTVAITGTGSTTDAVATNTSSVTIARRQQTRPAPRQQPRSRPEYRRLRLMPLGQLPE